MPYSYTCIIWWETASFIIWWLYISFQQSVMGISLHLQVQSRVYCCHEGRQDMPVFAVVKNVYVYNTSRVLFQVQEVLTIYFRRHLHTYNVELPTSPVITYTHQEQLLDPVPLSKLKLSWGYFIVCHHYITPYSWCFLCVTNYLHTVSIHDVLTGHSLYM